MGSVTDRIRKKYWARIKKLKLKSVSEINKEKLTKVIDKISEIKTLTKCAEEVLKYNKKRQKE